MPDSSIPPAETDTRFQLAALKYQRAAGKLYEDLIRATRDARDRQSKEGIHTAVSYMRRTADALIERFQTVEELFETNYLNVYKHQPMSDEDNTWLREQAAAIVDAELKRVQDLIEKLGSSFIGGSAQQYAKYVSAAESEAAFMKARIENGITIQILEHQGPNPKPSHVPVKWDRTSVGTTHAVLIGIETYQKQDISPVQYALADAAALKEVLVQHFGVTPENISLWLDSAATRSAFENDLPYLIRGLSPGDRFIFFYAGHGFYANGTNRLTTWDTHPNNLFGTTVSLEEVLLKPLKEHQGVDSLVFIDACAADLKTSIVQGRDIVSDLTRGEFEALVQSTDHAAVFFACSPNEKAYPSDTLMHGIWTYHLIQALQGDAEDALDRYRFITGESLKNYLTVAVPAFIRENTKIQVPQRPYAILSSNGPFSIRQVPPSGEAKPSTPASDEAKSVPEQPTATAKGNRPQIMLSAIEGHYNQWNGNVFTVHHLGGDVAVQLEIAPIRFEGFNQVSLHFEAVPFVGPTKPDAMVHFHVLTNDDSVPKHVDKPSFAMMSFVYDAQHLNKPEVSYPVIIRYKWGAKTEEEHFQITWNNNRRRMTIAPSNAALKQKERKHNIVFLNPEVVKLAYSGPGFSDRTDGKHYFSEVEGVSTGDMVGLVARFRNEAIFGEDVVAVLGVRAHLKLFDRNGKEIGTGFSGAQWLGHPADTFDLIPNGRGGSVIVCRGGKTTKPRVMWKSTDTSGRLRDRDLELNEGYPSRAEVTLMDSNHKPLFNPVVLEIADTGVGVSVSAKSNATEPS
jgi:hypothetical protein